MQAGASAVARASATRAYRLSICGGLPVLRRGFAQARRGRHRDVGADPTAMESDPACAGEVLLPDLRGNHTTASAFSPDCAWARRTGIACTRAVLQIRLALAAHSAEHDL